MNWLFITNLTCLERCDSWLKNKNIDVIMIIVKKQPIKKYIHLYHFKVQFKWSSFLINAQACYYLNSVHDGELTN